MRNFHELRKQYSDFEEYKRTFKFLKFGKGKSNGKTVWRLDASGKLTTDINDELIKIRSDIHYDITLFEKLTGHTIDGISINDYYLMLNSNNRYNDESVKAMKEKK